MKDYKLPETVTKTLYVSLGLGRFNRDQIDIQDRDPEAYIHEGFESVLLTTVEITIDIPADVDVKSKLLAVLEKRKSGIQAEYHMKLKDVQDDIDNLLAIEHKPQEQENDDAS